MASKKTEPIEMTPQKLINLLAKIREHRVRASLNTVDYTANMNLNAGLELACDEVEKYFKFKRPSVIG